MEWNKKLLYDLEWCREISNYDQKWNIAKRISKKVKDGDVIGFGSGSTSFLTAIEISKRIKQERIHIKAIPTSKEMEYTCQSLGIETTSIEKEKPNWAFDGADEVDPNGWLIKGRGGAFYNEKLIMKNSNVCYILVDDSKFVDKLCTKFPIPVEVMPSSIYYVKSKLYRLGAEKITLRQAVAKDGPVITENGNLILDVHFPLIKKGLEGSIKRITGVIETGLFINYKIEIVRL